MPLRIVAWVRSSRSSPGRATSGAAPAASPTSSDFQSSSSATRACRLSEQPNGPQRKINPGEKMNPGNRFTLFFFGSFFCLLTVFFWGVRRMPSVPQSPPPVRLGPASLQAVADKEAAFHNDTAKFSIHQGLVQIDIHNVLPPSYKPLESLAVCLDRYPKASHFRVRWHGYWSRHGSVTDVLYDRRTHLLFYTCYVTQIPWGSYHDRSVFHGVTDFALKQDAKDHKHPQPLSPDLVRQRDIEDLDIVFADLPHYGCPRQSVKGR